jgi:hypothetical protein
LAQAPRKAVASCEKPRLGASSLRTWDCLMGLPVAGQPAAFAVANGNPGNGNILVPGGKESNCDALSNGE